MSKFYISITDTDWMNFLRNETDNYGDYINFWTPGKQPFKAIESGDLFLFKLHSRKAKGENGEIVGGAYFHSFEIMPASSAWDKFGYGNGATSLTEMKTSINKYRSRNNMDQSTDEIGCIILYKPFFFEPSQWIESPSDWGKSIVRGKVYDTSTEIGNALYEEVNNQLIDTTPDDTDLINEIESEVSNTIDGQTRKAFINVRVNQGVFRDKLLHKYSSCCLCKVSNPSLLRASHIKPWADSEPTEKLDVDNGFLLCPNHDSLFDAGYITFNDDGTILISSKLSQVDQTFMNVMPTMKIELTEKNKEYLAYHRSHVFLG